MKYIVLSIFLCSFFLIEHIFSTMENLKNWYLKNIYLPFNYPLKQSSKILLEIKIVE